MAVRPGFQIEYEIKLVSADMGNGIFSKQFVPKGALIWKYDNSPGGNVKSYSGYEETRKRLQELSVEDQNFFISHVYLFDNVVNEIIDDGKFWNHSENPNSGFGPSDYNSSFATRDIYPGDELVDDYGIYEYPEWFVELAKEYNVPQDFITIKLSVKPGFNIPYEIKESPGRGFGIFATEFIPVNSLIWKFYPDVNLRCFDGEAATLQHLQTLSQEDRVFWLSHVYLFAGKVNEILDDGKMWNHSENPNTSSGYLGDWDSTYAARDIAAGEELLDDYGQYEYPEWFSTLCREYGVPQDYFVIKTK